MSVRSFLQQYPVAHDLAKTASRYLGNQTDLYKQLYPALSRMRPITFLQAGANDGLTHDPFREYIVWKDTRGILVEPLPFFFELLQKNYRCKPAGLFFEKCALSNEPGEMSFYTLDPEYLKTIPYEPTLYGVAGFSYEHMEKHFPPESGLHQYIKEVRVPVRTIEDLMKSNGLNSIDCLFLDIEGHEPTILLNLDYEVVQPKVIVYEFLHLGDQRETVDNHLLARGFKLHQCDRDTVAIRS